MEQLCKLVVVKPCTSPASQCTFDKISFGISWYSVKTVHVLYKIELSMRCYNMLSSQLCVRAERRMSQPDQIRSDQKVKCEPPSSLRRLTRCGSSSRRQLPSSSLSSSPSRSWPRCMCGASNIAMRGMPLPSSNAAWHQPPQSAPLLPYWSKRWRRREMRG